MARKRETIESQAATDGVKEYALNEPVHKKRRRGRWLIWSGLALVVVGLLTLAGIYLYLFFTNRSYSQAQSRLGAKQLPDPNLQAISVGDGIARIVIPRIGLDAIVVELADMADNESLKKGPGHIQGTAYPGQAGNCVISGHRTTYGAPFRAINELQPGDEIILRTAAGDYTYHAIETRIVEPTDLSVLEQGTDKRVTLTACHPWYSAAQRIIVIGVMEEPASPPLPE